MYKKILIVLKSYLIIKKPWKTIKENSFLITSLLKSSRIHVNGKDNIVKIDNGNLKRIKIGVDGNGNSILIQSDVYIRNLEIIIQGNNHKLSIGEGVEIGGASIVCCGESSKVTIGENCLLASNIKIKSCDGHSIYKNNRVINNSKDIVIAQNVWIAQDVNILKGVSIGSNSVVGMNSLVTSNVFPKNVILGGSPAKIIKKEITWGKERTLWIWKYLL